MRYGSDVSSLSFWDSVPNVLFIFLLSGEIDFLPGGQRRSCHCLGNLTVWKVMRTGINTKKRHHEDVKERDTAHPELRNARRQEYEPDPANATMSQTELAAA